jgi:hypothetical protein
MKRIFLATVFLVLASMGLAQSIGDPGKPGPPTTDPLPSRIFPPRPDDSDADQITARVTATNLTYHGGPVITNAKVVSIFWGPSATWGTQSSPSVLASTLTGFFGNFGTTGEYNVITQYSAIRLSNLTTQIWIDNSTPPTRVTDSALQGEVRKYLNAFHGGVGDSSTIYSVFLPPASYSTIQGASSCGGPNLQFCAYHSNFSYNGVDVKYSSLPYPSCSGCQWPGWSVAMNFEHFACHETREAVTDPDGNAWYDSSGNEADDKCAWSPALFTDRGFGYQYEWSNASSACVKTR